MFDIDKVINETNKKLIYGEKPKLPEKLSNVYLKKIDDDAFVSESFNQAERQIINALNKIIDYLEWENKLI